MIDLTDPAAMRAEAERRQRLRAQGKLTFEELNDSVAIADVDDDALEDVHVLEGEKLLRALGFKIVRFSQKKRAKVTPGIPDRKCYHEARRLTFWWEAKAGWGRQSSAQREFQVMAEAVGEIYILGGFDALTAWLVENRIAEIVGGSLEPIAP